MYNINQIKRIVQSSLYTTGVIRYSITYVPKLGAYRITLVGSRQGINGSALGRLIDALTASGYNVRVSVSKAPLFNIVYLYASPKV